MNEHGKKSSVNLEIFKEIGWKKRGILFFATWFYTGLIPFAPGTWGSIAALPFAALANSLGPLSSSLSIALMLIVSIPVSGMAAEIMRMEDPSSVVIDEVAGIFVTLFLIPVSWMSVIIGFILFRIFDILKPFPVGLIDKKLHGGTGIVLDDVMAGIYANVGLRLILILVN